MRQNMKMVQVLGLVSHKINVSWMAWNIILKAFNGYSNKFWMIIGQ